MQNTDIQILNDIDHDQGWARLQAQQLDRTPNSPDQIWIMNVRACYSAGNDLRNQPIPETINGLPVLRSRRGGAMTYYAPGQLHLGMVLDIQRINLDPDLATQRIMTAAATVLQRRFNCQAQIRNDDVGIYNAAAAKIGSIGFIFKNGVLVGGLTLNMCTDLGGFELIEVCGVRRTVANVLQHQASWPELVTVGQDMATEIQQQLYLEA
jgi:lipoyl(octanoyl) transferase